jgi:hypothetical protein
MKIVKYTKALVKYITDRNYRFLVNAGKGRYNKMSDEEYLKKCFKACIGKDLHLDNPQTYNEKLQWLKLYNRNPAYTVMVDKYKVRDYIKETIGEEYLIPLLGVWDKAEDIDFDKLPNQFVLKCTHDSGGLYICRNKSIFDRRQCVEYLNKRLSNNYYKQWREWPYKNVSPKIIAEQYIDVMQNTPLKCGDIMSVEELQCEQGLLDYKFMCFSGRVQALFLDIGVVKGSSKHAENYYRNVYDREFNLLPVKETRENYPLKIKMPDNFNQMVEIAEKLSSGMPHVRVDLYNVKGRIFFGEFTFFHGSGLSNFFVPKEWDKIFGDWIELPKKRDDTK